MQFVYLALDASRRLQEADAPVVLLFAECAVGIERLADKGLGLLDYCLPRLEQEHPVFPLPAIR